VLRSLRAEATGAPRSLWVARCVEAGWRRDGGLRLVNARACAHGLVHDGGWRSGRAAARVLAVTPNMTKPSSPSGVRASCCPFLGSDKWALSGVRTGSADVIQQEWCPGGHLGDGSFVYAPDPDDVVAVAGVVVHGVAPGEVALQVRLDRCEFGHVSPLVRVLFLGEEASV